MTLNNIINKLSPSIIKLNEIRTMPKKPITAPTIKSSIITKITPMPNKITDIKLTSPLMRNPKNNSNKHNAATTPIKLILGEYN